MKPFAKKFYKSKAWRDCRAAFFTEQHGLCQCCGAGGKIVHHKIKLTPQNIYDPRVTLDWENLELLCLACHGKEHSRGSTAPGTGFDSEGDLVKT